MEIWVAEASRELSRSSLTRARESVRAWPEPRARTEVAGRALIGIMLGMSESGLKSGSGGGTWVIIVLYSLRTAAGVDGGVLNDSVG